MCDKYLKHKETESAISIDERIEFVAVSDVVSRAKAIAVDCIKVKMIALEQVMSDARIAHLRLDSELAALNRE
jgi:predicted nucleotidyltransferase